MTVTTQESEVLTFINMDKVFVDLTVQIYNIVNISQIHSFVVLALMIKIPDLMQLLISKFALWDFRYLFKENAIFRRLEGVLMSSWFVIRDLHQSRHMQQDNVRYSCK